MARVVWFWVALVGGLVVPAAEVSIRFVDPYGKPKAGDRFRILDRFGKEVPADVGADGGVALENGNYVLELLGDYRHKRTPFVVTENSDRVTVLVEPMVTAHVHRLRRNSVSLRCGAGVELSVKLVHVVTGEMVEKRVMEGAVLFPDLPDGRYLVLLQRRGEPVGDGWTEVGPRRSGAVGVGDCFSL